MKVLAADIGGTNTRFMIAEVNGNNYQLIHECQYPSIEFTDFDSVLDLFITSDQGHDQFTCVCLAVAGPVINDTVKVTNLPWTLNASQLSRHLNNRPVFMINDFVAVAYGISMLKVDDYIGIQGIPQSDFKSTRGDAVVIGAGTGLGAVHLVSGQQGYHALSSEAGHAGFAPSSQLQTELLAWMQETHDFVCLEMLLSGKGIYRIYQFLRDVKGIAESEQLRNLFEVSDPAQIISESAFTKADQLSIKTIECFVEIYATAASDIALHYYPVSEVYIAGGIAPKIRFCMTSEIFINAFNRKGLMSENMKKLPVKLVMEERVGLLGALAYADKSCLE